MSTVAPTATLTLVRLARDRRPAGAAPARISATISATTAAAAPAAAPAGRLVLTRRGRRTLRLAAFACATSLLAAGLVVLWLTVAAVVAPGAVAGDGSEGVRSGATVAEAQRSTTTVVVAPGDTLWQIARSHSPERDPRSVVDDIVGLNGLSSTGVQVGAQLLVPTG